MVLVFQRYLTELSVSNTIALASEGSCSFPHCYSKKSRTSDELNPEKRDTPHLDGTHCANTVLKTSELASNPNFILLMISAILQY
jgi:hypothetical protein